VRIPTPLTAVSLRALAESSSDPSICFSICRIKLRLSARIEESHSCALRFCSPTNSRLKCQELPLHLAQLVLLRIRHGGRLWSNRLSKGTEHTCIAEAKRNIIAISLQDAAAKSQSGEAVIVDVPEKDEWDEEQIPNATHLSRGTIELDIEAAGLPMTK